MKLSELPSEDFVKEIQQRFKDGWGIIPRWRQEARECYEFYNGYQWTDEDIAALEEQGRPSVTFNRVGKIIDAISGAEVINRQEVKYLPRTNEDLGQTEVYNAANQWSRDECDAEDEESDAFRDTLITGMGWTFTDVKYEDNPDGMVCIERVDPFEMRWESGAKQRNITDSRWLLREKWVHDSEIRARWPNAELIPETQEGQLWSMEPHDADDDWKYEGLDPSVYSRGYDPENREYRLVNIQWYELEPFYRSFDDNGEVLILDEEPDDRPSTKQTRKVYWNAYVAGNNLLERRRNKINQFNYKCITGKRDHKYNYWYGIMRAMMDPQNWANKFFSQMMHIFNSSPKGGFFWETGALAHPDRAKDDMNRPEGMVELNPGGLPKIQERSGFQIPSNVDRLLQYSLQAIPDVSGVNTEFLGQVERDQPGIVEAQRIKQALGIVSVIFDSLRRYRKLQGRVMLEMIHEYIADNRLIRVMGPEGAQFVELIKQDNIQYDVIVDQSPTSPNARTEAWFSLTQMLPILQNAGFPIIPEVLDYMPLPATMISKWKQAYNDPRIAQMQQVFEKEIAKLEDENLILKAKREERKEAQETKQSEAVLEDERERERIDIERFDAETKRLKVAQDGGRPV